MLKWCNDYITGISEVDAQHQRLFDIANKVYGILKNNYYFDKYDLIIEILTELKEYTQYHFDYEEKYMKSIDYNGYEQHKSEHDKFIEKIRAVDFQKIDSHQDDYLLELLDFIVTWITNHIIGEDLKLPRK